MVELCQTYESLDNIQDLSKLQLLQDSFRSACKEYKFSTHTECYLNSEGVPLFFDLYSTFGDTQTQDESAYVLANIQAQINRCNTLSSPYTTVLKDQLVCTLDPVHPVFEEGLKLPKTYQLVWLYEKNSKRLFNIINKVKCRGDLAGMCKRQLDDLSIYRGLKFDAEV